MNDDPKQFYVTLFSTTSQHITPIILTMISLSNWRNQLIWVITIGGKSGYVSTPVLHLNSVPISPLILSGNLELLSIVT